MIPSLQTVSNVLIVQLGYVYNSFQMRNQLQTLPPFEEVPNSERKHSTETTASDSDLTRPLQQQEEAVTFPDMEIHVGPQFQLTIQSFHNERGAPHTDSFPCSQCGSHITMQELDDHMRLCPISRQKCSNCNQFLLSTQMLQHRAQCQQRETQPQSSNDLIVFPNNEDDWITFEQPSQANMPPTNTNYAILEEQNSETISLPDLAGDQQWIWTDHQTTSQQPLPSSPGSIHLGPVSPPFYPQDQFTIHIQQLGEDNLVYFISRPELDQSDHFRRYITLLMDLLMSARKSAERTLTLQQIEKLPRVNFTGDDKFGSCTICMRDYEEGESLIKLPCGHLFEQGCIKPWLENSTKCPNCRATVTVEEQHDAPSS